jgi:4-diphosphocytidyl-2-C-methyl-D-erythritol kinase
MKTRLKAPAKINLTLEIIKKLPSGFHKLRSVMLKTENLYDEVGIDFIKNSKKIEIECDDNSIPKNEKNICWKVADKFFKKTGKRIGLRINIKKRIPAMAGLGGGSSNGAIVLLSLNSHFKNILSEKELVRIAAEIGKDIPFFLGKESAAYVTGEGEKIKTLNKFPKLSLLIINPKGEISTKEAYSELDGKMWFMSDRGRKNISLDLTNNFSKINNITTFLYNDFEITAEEKFPVIKELKNCLISFGALGVSLTGKGPTIFGIFKNKNEALKIKKILNNKYPDFFIELG